jgi:hypothetical protein
MRSRLEHLEPSFPISYSHASTLKTKEERTPHLERVILTRMSVRRSVQSKADRPDDILAFQLAAGQRQAGSLRRRTQARVHR